MQTNHEAQPPRLWLTMEEAAQAEYLSRFLVYALVMRHGIGSTDIMREKADWLGLPVEE